MMNGYCGEDVAEVTKGTASKKSPSNRTLASARWYLGTTYQEKKIKAS